MNKRRHLASDEPGFECIHEIDSDDQGENLNEELKHGLKKDFIPMVLVHVIE